MKRFRFFLITITVLLAFTLNARAQNIVANYSFGQLNSDEYEHFEFWNKNEQRGDIYYSFGSTSKTMKLRFLGTETVNGESCFKVRFLNDLILYVALAGKKLHVFSSSKKYDKVFEWEYIGPVDGKGTFCSVCATEGDQAAAVVGKFIPGM